MNKLQGTRILFRSALIVMMTLMLCSPSEASQKKEKQAATAPKTVLNAEQQQIAEKKSYEIFETILELTQTADEDPKALEQIEKLYFKIMDEYQTTELAAECHWYLVKMYIRQNTQEAYQKARTVYQQFLKRYPDSPLGPQIEKEMFRTPLHTVPEK